MLAISIHLHCSLIGARVLYPQIKNTIHAHRRRRNFSGTPLVRFVHLVDGAWATGLTGFCFGGAVVSSFCELPPSILTVIVAPDKPLSAASAFLIAVAAVADVGMDVAPSSEY